MSWGVWLALAAGAVLALLLFATIWQMIAALWEGSVDLLAEQVARKLRRNDRGDAGDG